MTAPYSGTMRIPTASPNIARVSLLTLGLSTHHYVPNMRLVRPQITCSDYSGINVSAPIGANIAAPGYYVIHLVNNLDVPWHAQIIKLPGP